MCYDCWQEKGGGAKIANDKVITAVLLIGEVYSHHGAGGGLHIMLDDWNIDDEDVEFCENNINRPDYEASPERLEAERKCLEAFKAMTIEERASALALESNFFAI